MKRQAGATCLQAAQAERERTRQRGYTEMFGRIRQAVYKASRSREIKPAWPKDESEGLSITVYHVYIVSLPR